MKVKNMTSERTGRAIANQFMIYADDATYFQSYNTVIAKQKGDVITLDAANWDYSRTTGKYRNQFLGETKKETERKIASGEYKLANLNR